MDKKKKSAGSSCEYCMNYEYDEDYEYYVVPRIWIRTRCIGLSPGSSGNVRIIVQEMSTVL